LALNQECEHLIQDIEVFKQRFNEVTRESEVIQRDNQLLTRKCDDTMQLFKEAE
jgi:hypothetical protein